MKGRGLLLLLLTALLSGSPGVPGVYRFINHLNTWSEAQRYCRERYTDLATVHNMDDMKELHGSIDSGWLEGVWIGLRRKRKGLFKWKWSDGGGEDGGAEFRKWANGEGDTVGSSCAFMKGNGLWYATKCEDVKFVSCYKVNPGTKLKEYMAIRQKVTWPDAQRICRERFTDLASVRSEAESARLLSIKPPGTFWIGLLRDAWSWSDGSSSSFRSWGAVNLSGVGRMCVEHSRTRVWKSQRCLLRLPFVCNGDPPLVVFRRGTDLRDRLVRSDLVPPPPPAAQTLLALFPPGIEKVKRHRRDAPSMQRQVVRLTLMRDSGVNLEDPAVREAILQQFKVKLLEGGISQDVGVSWRTHPDGKVFHKQTERFEEKRRMKRKTEL